MTEPYHRRRSRHHCFLLRSLCGDFAPHCAAQDRCIRRLDPCACTPYSRFDLSACIAPVGSVFSLRVCSRDLPLVVACTPASREAQFGHVEPTYLKVGAQTSQPRPGGGQEASQLHSRLASFFARTLQRRCTRRWAKRSVCAARGPQSVKRSACSATSQALDTFHAVRVERLDTRSEPCSRVEQAGQARRSCRW